MEYYKTYMDRQEISSEVHKKLLSPDVKKRGFGPDRVKYGVLAACAALIVGAGVWRLTPAPAPAPEQSAGLFTDDYTPLPGEKDMAEPDDLFVVNSPVEEGGSVNFLYMPAIAFPDVTGALQADAARARMPGSFTADLTREDVQKLFWGPEGIPESHKTEIGRQDLPWALFWDGYTVCGHAWYNGEGKLLEVIVLGEKDQVSFTLTLCPGGLPFSCVADPDRETSEAFGVEVAGWSRSNKQEGIADYTCGSEFMTKDNIGIRFENSGGSLEDAAWFNTLFVRQALTGGLCLDHLLDNENIPAWREEEFSTLAQARQEADFAPYLPSAEPSGYGEFYGRLSYQEGTQNMLFVRWSRGYDNVEVCVYRDGYRTCNLVSPDEPETYDLRRYPIPWCDSVPAEYRETVSSPAFRAEDMSLAIVETRGREHDTGGTTYSFDVLHPEGALVSYRCDGMTAQQVWTLVEETL